jgi:hypothetical protein
MMPAHPSAISFHFPFKSGGSMRRLLFIAFVVLLATCGPDRAQTIDAPAATETPDPAPSALPVTAEPTDLPITVAPDPTAVPEDAVPSPTPTTELEPTRSTESTGDIDEESLLAALLTLDDMPTGWTAEAATFEPRTPGGTYTSFCTDLNARSIAAATVDFQKSALGPFMSQTIVVYPTRDDAEAALEDLVAAARDCTELVDDAGNTNTFSPLSFPAFGDDTFAMRSSGVVEMDIIQVRVDEVLINILHGGLGSVDSALTEEFVRLALDKYE